MGICFRPMLAHSNTPDLRLIKYPVLASPKLDGIRCIADKGKPLSRTLKSIPNKWVQHLFEKHGLDGLDGELMVEGDFNSVQSHIMSEQGQPNFTYYVFDVVDSVETFAARFAEASQRVDALNLPWVKLVNHVLINNADELKEFWNDCINEGYEGAMVRSLTGPYKRGRSTLREGYLIKLKMWHDLEAKVIGFEPLYTNQNEETVNELGQTTRSLKQEGMVATDTLGALVVSFNGQTFKVGSGFDLAERSRLWSIRNKLIGAEVTLKYQELSSYGIPRFPIYKGIRYE